MDNKEVLLKEIDLVQNVIKRMAQNSFYIKGWMISLTAVILALLPESFNTIGLCLVSLVVIVCFWILDSFFLKTEKLYRRKYEWIIEKRLTSNEYFFDLNPYNKYMWLSTEIEVKKETSIWSIMFSKTIAPLYLILFIFVALFLFYSIANVF